MILLSRWIQQRRNSQYSVLQYACMHVRACMHMCVHPVRACVRARVLWPSECGSHRRPCTLSLSLSLSLSSLSLSIDRYIDIYVDIK